MPFVLLYANYCVRLIQGDIQCVKLKEFEFAAIGIEKENDVRLNDILWCRWGKRDRQPFRGNWIRTVYRDRFQIVAKPHITKQCVRRLLIHDYVRTTGF